MNEKSLEKIKAVIHGNTGKRYPGRKLSETHKKNIALARKREWENGQRKRHWKQTPEAIERARLSHLGRKTPIEVRKKQSLARIGKYKGKKHWNWQGGKTLKRQRIYNSLEYRLWRESVFKRDNWTCVWCRVRGGRLEADHIKPWSLFPELRFAIDNGRTLCRGCHLKTDTYGGRVKKN